MRSLPTKLTLTLLVVLSLAVCVLEYCKPKSQAAVAPAANEFVGDAKCQSCHVKEYDLWKQSDHFKAMMPANDSTVLGDFNNATLVADGISSKFFRRDGKFYINTEGPDGRNQDFEVLYTFGYKPLQQYLIAFPGGRMQVPRVSWDVNKKKWFHQYAGQKIDHSDWLHWTGGGQNWNTMCASCHSTNLQKNYLADVDSFHTTYSVVTVSCESCHGPGKAHIDFVGSSGYKDGDRVKHAYLLPIDSPNVVQVNTCAPCHARKADISPAMVNPRELMETIIPEIPTTEFFHADGQVDDEDYIYTSFLQSKMFHRSVTCTNCHNAHSGKLVLPATQVCGQCHERKYFEFGHTKHEASLTQVNCISCHMPGKYYMGNDYRHDHSFRVPRPDLSVKHGTPNACNDCHTDKKPQWAAEAVAKWYGPQRAYHYAEDLIPGSEAGPSSETHLQKLIADTSVPDIVKATAAHYLSQVPTRTALATLKGLLKHGDPQVRYRSLRSLASFPPGQWRDDVFPLFNDKVRAVRIAAADLCLTIPVEQVPEDFRNAMANARNELSEYLLYQRDFSVGNVMLGDYYYRQNDLLNAEKYYWRGLQKDGQMNYARFNLSALYNTQSKNQDALKVLEEARAIDPQNPRVYYNLGLLYVELQDNGKALDNLSKAVDKGMTDPRLFYNLGILNQQMGKAAEAERIFLKGLKPSPNDPDLNYALAFLYMQQNQLQKALGPASILKRLDPNNPNYQPLFRQLQL